MLAVDQRNRLAPVALARKHPVAQLIIDLALAQALFLQIVDDGLDGVLHLQAVENAGIDHHAILYVGIGGVLHIAPGDHFHDGQAKFLGKLPVALVVGGHGHDGAGAVAHEHIIRHPHGDFLAVDGVHGADALDFHAGLVLVQLRALKVALAGGGVAVGGDFLVVFDLRLVLFEQRVLRRHDHVGRAKERVRTGGEDAQFVAGREGEVYLRALGTANPVALLHLDLFDEIHIVEAVEQLLGIVRDAQHPLGLDLAHHLAAAALTMAADHFFIGQTDLAGGTPVDGHLHFVSQALFKQLQENPLRPLVVFGIGGGNLAVVIKGETKALKLGAEAGDVLLGDDGGVDFVFNGVVFRRQAESVVADGEKHVVALHAALAGDDVHSRVGARMAHVQARARGVGELNQRVKLGLVVRFFGGKGVGILPVFLPLLFHGVGGIDGNILHVRRSSCPK